MKNLPQECTYRQTQMMKREFVESDLTFLGLLIMENRLKPKTSEVIKKLNECEVRTIMATGDNILTAISVARKCGIVEPHKEIMLGDIEVDQDTGISQLKWSS